MPLFSQTVITGRVLTNYGEPVQGVNIYCIENDKGTSTDSLGYFILECPIPATLEFTHINYRTEIYKLTKSNAPFIIVLRNKVNNLKEVVITGVTNSSKIKSTTHGIEKIPAILGEYDILKYLATVPGVITTNALNSGIYVRGGNSHENDFLINNISIINPEHLTGVLSTFDPYILSNSTIFKSGFPARYNSYLSSYINMRPDLGNKNNHEGELTLGLVSSAIKMKGPIVKDHTSYAFSFRTSYLQHIARLYNNSVDENENPNYMPEYSFTDFTGTVDSKFSDKLRISAFGLFSTDKMIMEINPNSKYKFDWRTFSGNVTAFFNPSRVSRWEFQIGGTTNFSQGDASGSLPKGGGNRHYSFLSNVGYNLMFSEKINLNAGVRFNYSRFETANKMDGYNNVLFKSSDKEFYLYDIYGEIDYYLNDYFTFTGGLNYQFYDGDVETHTFSPRAKLSFTKNHFSIWLDYAKTAQYLTLYPYFTVKTPVDIWYPLAKNTKPAVCHQYSIGMNQDFGQLFSIYAGVFYKDMRKVKDFDSEIQTEYTALTDKLIQGTGHARGFELNFNLNHPVYYARANYTLSESKRKFKEINNGKSFFPPYDVKHNIIINFSVQMSPRLSLNSLWTFSSGVHTTFPTGLTIAHNITDLEDRPVVIPIYTDRYNYKLPSNHRLDANIDYLFFIKNLNLKLSVGAYNIYNQSNPAFVYFEPQYDSSRISRIVPKSKIMLPFIPYFSLRLNW